MQVTGYKLRNAIKLWEGRRDAAASQFGPALRVFENELEKVATPDNISLQFAIAEKNIATLQTAQAKYNLAVTVTVGDVSKYVAISPTMPLCEAIKRVGGIGRLEKMWREAATPKEDRYAIHGEEREPNKVYKVSTISTKKALSEAEQFLRSKNALAEAIAEGNGTRVEIEGLEPSLFE